MLIYPAIDLRNGQCVRLSQGRFDQVTVYQPDPVVQLQAFTAAGTEWVHIVDLDGAKAGAPAQHELIGRLARVSSVKLQVGGGVRHRDHVARLLDAGVARVVVGSAAVREPETVRVWLGEFGVERICCAFDVRIAPGQAPEVAIHGWAAGSGVALSAALGLFPQGTLAHILVTDVARDGVLAGPNVDLIKDLVDARPDLQIQASGGASSLDDLVELRRAGAAGAIIGRALYEGRFRLEDALGVRP